jgi:hypothetical protein
MCRSCTVVPVIIISYAKFWARTELLTDRLEGSTCKLQHAPSKPQTLFKGTYHLLTINRQQF